MCETAKVSHVYTQRSAISFGTVVDHLNPLSLRYTFCNLAEITRPREVENNVFGDVDEILDDSIKRIGLHSLEIENIGRSILGP